MCHTLNNFFFPRPLLYVGIESAGYPALDCTLHPAAPRGACHLRRRGCQVPSPRSPDGSRASRLVLTTTSPTASASWIPVLRRLACLLPEGSVIPARISVAGAREPTIRIYLYYPLDIRSDLVYLGAVPAAARISSNQNKQQRFSPHPTHRTCYVRTCDARERRENLIEFYSS